MSERRQGYRGYIVSRPIRGERTPQHVQNLVVRDYARRRGLTFLLSATEWAMPGCQAILSQVLDELPTLSGIICYSIFQLPETAVARRPIWRRVLESGAELHGALESLRVATPADVSRIEDLFLADALVGRAAWDGRVAPAGWRDKMSLQFDVPRGIFRVD